MQKILINAYACRPNFGSEGGAAWNLIIGLAQNHELYVITEGEWRDEIDVELKKKHLCNRIHFYYNPVSERIRRMCWNQGDYRFYYYYEQWQKKTLEIAREINRAQKIDLIHQLNMIGFREPGYLWKIKGPKFVWGPIGGMNLVPMQYLENASLLIKIKYIFKNIVSEIQWRYHPRVLKTINRSDALIAANRSSYEILNKYHSNKKIVLINETGCNIKQELSRINNPDSYNILFVGRFIPTKMLDLALNVIRQIRDIPGICFHVVGQAFTEIETQKYIEMAKDLGINDIVKWHGWVSHTEVQELMRLSDVFFFPSIVEGTPHVVLESISNGLPVVCFDICGQADAVNNAVGCKVKISNFKQSVKDFSGILNELNLNRSHLLTMSAECKSRCIELSWDNKVKKIESVYKSIE